MSYYERATYCQRGCTQHQQHLTDCEDPDQCRGCLPRLAKYGELCWPCHRRLELMLTDAETVDRWLGGNMSAGSGAARTDDLIVMASREAPAPIKVAVFDKRQELRDHWATWVDWLCERENMKTGLHTVENDSKRLLSWIDRIETWDVIGDLLEQTSMLLSEAHALAPWRPAMRRVGTIPCPECAEVNLVIFGGESDITCLSCQTMIPERAFGLWELLVKHEHGIEVA